MISLKKHMDGWSGLAQGDPVIDAYRSLLLAVGENSHRAVPGLGQDLRAGMAELAASLGDQRDSKGDEGFPEAVAAVHLKAKTEFGAWTEQAHKRHKNTEVELRKIITAMADAVESITGRDEDCAREMGALAERLRSITSLNDLVSIRRSIVESANSLTAFAARIAEAGHESVRRMRAEVEDYRSRLENSEKLSVLDPLTNLANRRRFEEQLEAKIREGHRFCLILIDLNDFKTINDRLGHLAGDEVLKSYAANLRSQFPSADLVARWGGDEFAVIINSNRRDAEARVGRMRRSSFGECQVSIGRKQPVNIAVEASIGVVEWDGSEEAIELMARADNSMYLGKHSLKAQRAG